MTWTLFLGVLFLLVFSTLSARAQTATISGHITDQSGAAVAKAIVVVQNIAAGVEDTSVSNHDGYYFFPPLSPGKYVLEVEHASFATSTVTGIQVEVNRTAMINVTLNPAHVSQTVTVSAQSAQLNTDSPSRGNVIESQFVQNTPLNIRNPLQLVNFAQGVTPYSSDSGNNDRSESLTNTFRINGGRLATTESLLDGADNTTDYDYDAVASVPQVDAVQEFIVMTTAYSPQFGHTSGGVVNYVTKSGTNSFHGSIFEFFRSSDFDANGYNANAAGLAKPNFQRNQLGYDIGGPIVIPHVYNGHNRTFFFATYEGLRQSMAGTFLGTVPTALERTGDFSQTRDTSGNLITMYDPRSTELNPNAPAGVTEYLRTPFAGNIIPAEYINSTGFKILNSYPLPNRPGEGQSDIDNYFSNATTKSSQNTVDIRIDHRLTDTQSMFARVDWFQRKNTFPDPYDNHISPEPGNQRLPGINAMLQYVWAIGPSVVVQQHVSFAHQESNRAPESLGYNATALDFNPNVNEGERATSFPQVSANRISSLGPQGGLEKNFGSSGEYAINTSWLKGSHSFQFGFDYRYLSAQENTVDQLNVDAGNNFTGGPNPQAAIADSGSGIADMLLGAATVSNGYSPRFLAHHPYYAFYAQDNYHATPKLTLLYGLRYNLELPDTEDNNQFVYLNLTSPSPLNSQVTSLGPLTGGPGFVGTDGVGRRIQEAQKLNFDPRAGFAYQVGTQTVVHGGFGIFHAPAAVISNESEGYAPTTTSNPAEANEVTPLFNLSDPFPQGLTQPTGSTLGLDTQLGQTIEGKPRKQKISYSEQWSLDVQRILPDNFVITVGYVGNNGLFLYSPLNANQMPTQYLNLGTQLLKQVPNPFYGIIKDKTSPLSNPTVQYGQLLRPHPQFLDMLYTEASIGSSSYNAMQLSIEHRFSHGFALLFNYTHSKTIDNVGDYETRNNNGLQNNYCPACDRSISGQDIPDVIRLSAQYELPFGYGKPWMNHGLLARVVGGWSVGSFYTWDNGVPVALSSPDNSDSFGGGAGMRPDATGLSTHVPGGRQMTNGGLYFNPAAFSQTPQFHFGTARRYIDSIRNPGQSNWDMLIAKRFKITGRVWLKFRGEFFNAFNNVQFAGPNTDMASPGFGHVYLSQVNTPRQIQFGLRLGF